VGWDGVGGGGNVLLDGEVSEECFGLWLVHVGGLPELVEADEATEPLEVGLFGAAGVVLAAEGLADRTEHSTRVSGHMHPLVAFGRRRG
jgi:hypothetical protein